MKRLVFLIAGVLAIAACGSDPADVEGTYTVGVTNREDACNFGWMVGQMNAGITVVITQNGEHANAEIQGFAGLAVGAAVGTNMFSGAVDGDTIDLVATGTNPKTSGNCTFTYDGRIEATATGNAIEGTIRYVANTNTASDCAAVQCESHQDFSGARPPK